MQTIRIDARIFSVSDDSLAAAADIKWARKILAGDDWIAPNGRSMHAIAGDVIEKAEDTLIDYLMYQ